MKEQLFLFRADILWFGLLFYLIYLRCVLLHPSFIHVDEMTKQVLWITLKEMQIFVGKVARSLFWIIVSNHDTHLVGSYYILKCLYKIFCSRSLEMPTHLHCSIT